MAEPKKTSEKTKRSRRPSTTAKPGEGVIEGAAVEKPTAAQSARSMDELARPQNRPSTGQDLKLSNMLASQSVAVVMAGISVAVAFIALAVSILTYQQASDEIASGQPATSAAMNGVDEVELDKIGQRIDLLATLIAQNADHFASMQNELASAKANGPKDVPAKTNLDDLMARLSALEAAGAAQIVAPAAHDEPASRGGFETTQIGLLVAAGLLTENLTGRDIEIWVGALDDLQWPGVDVADRDIIRSAARTPVDSRVDLLRLGRLQLAPMVQGLNKADDGSGLLEQARARLANLIQLRRTGGGIDQPETVLASFERALDNADFDSAYAAANMWSSAGFDGLEPWLMAAQRRHDLDQAVNRLVALFVQHAAGNK